MADKPVILVVDDDAPILLLMRNLLREYGFETVTASNGVQAIAAAREQHPALALLDKNMPGMTGEEVIRALRSEPGLEQLPILILSGEPVTRAQLAELAANGAVQKPFDIPDLIGRIREHVGG